MRAPPRIYHGWRPPGRAPIVEVDQDLLGLHRDIVDEASAFDWGADTAGARQLAVALLAEHAPGDEEFVREFYGPFTKYLTALNPQKWVLTTEAITSMLEQIDGFARFRLPDDADAR